MRRKYESWGDFLKKRREAHYRSAREFCTRVTVGISYPQYSRYEAGDQLPNLEQALELCRLLEIPPLEGLLEWNRAQIHGHPSKEHIDAILGRVREHGIEAVTSGSLPTPKGVVPAASTSAATGKSSSGLFTNASISPDDVIVFNRSHLRLFSSDPAYRDIFTYVNSYAPEWISCNELSQSLGIAIEKVEEMLEKLSDLGVILLAAGRCRATKKNFYFPDDEEFFELRNINLSHNTAGIMKRLNHEDLRKRRAFRGLLTREMTAEQLEMVISKIEELMGAVIDLPETSNPEKIYSMCVLLGERFSRPAAASAQEGLRRGIVASAPAIASEASVG
jgi:transcriptional regulator with XRE-family HTH domain